MNSQSSTFQNKPNIFILKSVAYNRFRIKYDAWRVSVLVCFDAKKYG